jgi:hypothetical protein
MGCVAMERFVQKATTATRKKTNSIGSMGRRVELGQEEEASAFANFLNICNYQKKEK